MVSREIRTVTVSVMINSDHADADEVMARFRAALERAALDQMTDENGATPIVGQVPVPVVDVV